MGQENKVDKIAGFITCYDSHEYTEGSGLHIAQIYKITIRMSNE